MPPRPENELTPAGVTVQRGDIAAIANLIIAQLAGRAFQAVHQFETFPVLALEVGDDALAELEASSFWVARVVEDEVHAPDLAQSIPLIGADQAWARGFDGSGVMVAILDTGVDAAIRSLGPGRGAGMLRQRDRPQRHLPPNGQSTMVGGSSAAPCPLSSAAGTARTSPARRRQRDGGRATSPAWRGTRRSGGHQVFSGSQSGDCGAAVPLSWTSDFMAALGTCTRGARSGTSPPRT